MTGAARDQASKWDTGPAVDARRRAALLEAAAAMQVPLSDAVADRLMAYLALMQQWNKVYNLTALRHADEMLSHHLLDCLAVVPGLRRHAAELGLASMSVLDVGSGGGLPGVVLAAIEPAWRVSCVDAVGKKATFIRQVAAELRLPNLQGLHARVEALVPTGGGFDLITSRAFASLGDFVSLTRQVLTPTGVWMAMKGRHPEDELAELPGDVEMFHVEPLQVPGLDAQRCLVWMRRRSV